MAKDKITLLCFAISRGEIIADRANGSREWSDCINLKEEYQIKARDALSICQELEEKHGFELVCHWPIDEPVLHQFILRKRNKNE